jgi:hypothetical protein
MSAGGRSFLTRSKLRDVVIVLSIGSALFFDVTFPGIMVSLFLLALGSFVHVVSKGVLIRNEVICRNGIYAIIRHPYYLANYLVDASFCLLSGNPYLTLCYPFLFFWSYGPTFRQEERTLKEKHGEAVVEHILSAPGLFPDRRSIRNLKSLFQGFAVKRVSAKEVARILRFCAMWLLILMVNVLTWGDLCGMAAKWHLWSPPLYFMAGAVILYVSSTLILRLRKRH